MLKAVLILTIILVFVQRSFADPRDQWPVEDLGQDGLVLWDDSGYDLLVEIKGSDSLTFEFQDKSIILDKDDLMSLQRYELEALGVLIRLHTMPNDVFWDDDIRWAWGKNLLPRFFKED